MPRFASVSRCRPDASWRRRCDTWLGGAGVVTSALLTWKSRSCGDHSITLQRKRRGWGVWGVFG